MLFRPNPSSGVPIYLQLMEQVKHAIETGALRPGEQLPGIRPLAEELVVNPNTVAKAYRELEHEGVVELRQGAGAFIARTGADEGSDDRVARGTTGGHKRSRETPRARPHRRRDSPAVRSRARRPQPDRSPSWLTRSPLKRRRSVKTYDGVQALQGLDLHVPAGSIFGFLGRNGAGKTTTIKVLLGMTRPTAGSGRVFGLPCDAPDASVQIRRRIGFVSDDKDLYGSLTVEEMIGFTASFFPRWRKELERRYVQAFELPLERKVKALSRGTRTKLALLLAFCRDADLLILDEPTSGLDPAMTEEVLQMLVRHVAERSTTVFFSSHHIAEVDQIADHVAIVDHGRTSSPALSTICERRYRRVQLVFDGDAPDARFRRGGREASRATRPRAQCVDERRC